MEHYREKSDLRWELLRKLADKAVLEEMLKDFTEDKIPFADPDSGPIPPNTYKHVWISQQSTKRIWISNQKNWKSSLKKLFQRKVLISLMKPI